MAKLRLGLDLRLYGAEHSGLGRYAEELLRALIDYGVGLEIVAFVDPRGKKIGELSALGVATVNAPYRPYSWQEQFLLPGVIKRARVDLMHFPHFNVPLAYGGPYVVTIHDLIMHHFPWRITSQRSWPVFLAKHLAYRLNVRLAIARAEAIIAVSHYTAEDILNYYPKAAERLLVIYEPTPSFTRAPVPRSGGAGTVPDFTANHQNNDKDVLLAYNIRQPIVLMVGNFYPHKNIRAVIGAWQRLYQALKRQLVLAGRLDVFGQRLLNEARNLGLAGDTLDSAVRFIGFVPDEDLFKLYCMSEYYFTASLLEGVGLTGIEALAAGTPVLSSPHGSLPEIYAAKATYIPVDSEELIYGAWRQIFASPRKVIKPSSARVSAKEVAESLQNCYLNVFHKSRALARGLDHENKL